MEIIKARQILKPNKIIIFYHQSWSPAFEQDKELFGQDKELFGQDNTLMQTRLPCLNLMSLKISFPLFVHVFTTKCTESRGPSFRILTWTVFHTELSWTDDSFVEYEKQFVLNFILPSPTASCLRDCILETRRGGLHWLQQYLQRLERHGAYLLKPAFLHGDSWPFRFRKFSWL